MFANLGGIHLLIILGIVVLLFGATKLPALSKGIAQSMKIFRNEMATPAKDAKGTGSAAGTASGTESTASTAAPVPHTTTVVNPDGSTTTTTTTSSNDFPPRA